jgi:hypothetical protein
VPINQLLETSKSAIWAITRKEGFRNRHLLLVFGNSCRLLGQFRKFFLAEFLKKGHNDIFIFGPKKGGNRRNDLVRH